MSRQSPHRSRSARIACVTRSLSSLMYSVMRSLFFSKIARASRMCDLAAEEAFLWSSADGPAGLVGLVAEGAAAEFAPSPVTTGLAPPAPSALLLCNVRLCC